MVSLDTNDNPTKEGMKMPEERKEIITAVLQDCIDRVIEVRNLADDDELRSLLAHLVVIAWSKGGEDAVSVSPDNLETLIASGFKRGKSGGNIE